MFRIGRNRLTHDLMLLLSTAGIATTWSAVETVAGSPTIYRTVLRLVEQHPSIIQSIYPASDSGIIIMHRLPLPLYPILTTTGTLKLVTPSSPPMVPPLLDERTPPSQTSLRSLPLLLLGLHTVDVPRQEVNMLLSLVKTILDTFQPATVIGEPVTQTYTFRLCHGEVTEPRIGESPRFLVLADSRRGTSYIARDGTEIVYRDGRCVHVYVLRKPPSHIIRRALMNIVERGERPSEAIQRAFEESVIEERRGGAEEGAVRVSTRED